MKTKTYWVTYSTEICDEHWHNCVLGLADLSLENIRDETRFDVRSVKRIRRADGGLDRYYITFIDGKRDRDSHGPRYLRISDPHAE